MRNILLIILVLIIIYLLFDLIFPITFPKVTVVFPNGRIMELGKKDTWKPPPTWLRNVRVVIVGNNSRNPSTGPESGEIRYPQTKNKSGIIIPKSTISIKNGYHETITIERLGFLLETYANKWNLDPEMVKAVCWQETNWGQLYCHPGGDGHGWGVMQIDDRYHSVQSRHLNQDIEANIDYGCWLLSTYGVRGYNALGSYASLIENHIKNKPWEKIPKDRRTK